MRTPSGRLLATALLAFAVLACHMPFARGTLGLLGDAHPDVLYSVETDAGVVALTIDDGPDAVATTRILELLAEHDARATFFLIGERIPGNEAVVDAIVAGERSASPILNGEQSYPAEPVTIARLRRE